MSYWFWSCSSSPATLRDLPLSHPISIQHDPPLQFPNFTLKTRSKQNRPPPIISCYSKSTESVETAAATTSSPNAPPPVIRKRRRYRKQYPGEKEGITEEMRFVAMRLRNVNGKKVETDGSDDGDDGEIGSVDEDGGGGGGESWQPTMEGFVKYLVDSKLVFDAVERVVDESNHVSYAYFRKTGLERSEGLSKDLEWFSQQDIVIPPPSNPGVSYVKYLEELAEKSPPLFLCHFYNIYFSHIAGGQVSKTGVQEAFRRKRVAVLQMGGERRRVVERCA